MRIHVLSDVHLEFNKWPRQRGLADIACDVHVLAGDIGPGLAGLDWALSAFKRPVVYVAGNHEFYCQHTMQKWWEKARRKTQGTHVHLLENESVVIAGVRFVGATLWYDLLLFGKDIQEDIAQQVERASNDYRNIFRTRRGRLHHDADPNAAGFGRRREGDRLTWRTVVDWHAQSRTFLETELNKAGGWNRSVVVTHHAPSAAVLSDAREPKPIDAAYASDRDDLVARADLWIHGHTHVAREYAGKRGGRIVVNAHGYQASGIHATPGFAWDKVVEL